MSKHTLESRLIFLIAIIIGTIGAVGEAYLLYHELENTLPYKAVDYYFYSKIAHTGIYVSPIIAISVGLFGGFNRFWSALIVPVITCPLIFAVIFKIMSFIHYRGLPEILPHSGDFNPIKAAEQFYQYSFSMMFVGLVIGVFCSLLLYFLSKEKKMH